MGSTKKVLQVLGIILVNTVLFLSAIALYHISLDRILRSTALSIDLMLVGVLGIAAFIYWTLAQNKLIRRFGIGLLSVLVSLVVIFVFVLNYTIPLQTEFSNFKLLDNSWLGDDCYVTISFDGLGNDIETIPENILEVDSIQVQTSVGLFGMKTMRNNVRIVESKNCDHPPIDSSDMALSHLIIGFILTEQRCFEGAIAHYTSCLRHDSLMHKAYYQRGCIRMLQGRYELAYNDFKRGMAIRYGSSNYKAALQTHEHEIGERIAPMLDSIREKNYEGARRFLEGIEALADFQYYQERLAYCAERLRAKE